MFKRKVIHGFLGMSALAAALAGVTVHAQNQNSTSTGPQTGSQARGTQTSGQVPGQTSSQATGNTAQGSPTVRQGTVMGTTTTDRDSAAGRDAARDQTTGAGQTTTAGQTSGAGQTAGVTGSGTAGSGAPLNAADRKIVMAMAQQHMAEIEASRMAQNKSQSEEVKNFAQQMIDDHTRALGEVRQLAQARNLALPTELDRSHKAKANKLAALDGEAFDRAYMAQAGVSDHKKTHSMLRQAQAKAKDPELKALAARTLPVVNQHLNSAQQVHKHTATGSSRTQGTTGSSQPDDKPKQ